MSMYQPTRVTSPEGSAQLTAEDDVPDEGVWMVGHFDFNWITESVYPTEVEALRVVNGRGYGEAHFLPFGMEAYDAARAPRVTPPEGAVQ